MKAVTLIVLALFSFLHEERYVVSDYQCDNNQIKVKYEDNWYDVQLFNVFIKEDTEICGYLKDDIAIEFDSYVKVENPLNVYLFVNDTLLQQTLIDEGKAVTKIDNPKYKYRLKKHTEAVMKEVKNPNTMDTGMTNSKKIALVFILLWIILMGILIMLRIRKHKEGNNEYAQIHESEQKE